MDAQMLAAEFAALMGRLDGMEEVTDCDRIAKTATELQRAGYAPILLVEPADFLRASLAQIRAEVERIRKMPGEDLPKGVTDVDEGRVQAAMLLVTHFEQLNLLRLPDPKAWDDLIELYGED